MLDYQIIASGTGDYISPLPTINLNPGLNKIDIDLSNTNIQYGVPYILIVDDIYHQSYYMKFLKHEARIKNINLDSE